MKCDLNGLLTNAVSSFRTAVRLGRDGDFESNDTEMSVYYIEALDEVATHIMDVRRGAVTVQQFCDHYLIGENLGPVRKKEEK